MNMRIIDYKVVSGWLEDIETNVKEEMLDGWQPLGGISTVPETDDQTGKTVFLAAQAMVLYERELE